MRIALFVSVSLLPICAHAWEEVVRDEGIVVTQKEVPGRNLPTFRGVGAVKGSILEILAVLRDDKRRCEWQHKCKKAARIQTINDFEAIVYNRTDAPWPVDDRDTVLRSRIYTIKKDREYIAAFERTTHPRMPEVEDVVRMPSIRGHYKLKYMSPEMTRVEYQVNADPGGLLPGWLAKSASKDLPLKTLMGLRWQVHKTRGKYDWFMKKWDPARLPEGQDPPQPPSWNGQ